MLKILLEKWDKNKDKLRKALSERKCDYEYKDLVKLTFSVIFNDGKNEEDLDIGRITEINDGDYQGTLLYLIPFDTYQPTQYEYLMTYVYYGSCCGCDTLMSICCDDEDLPNKQQVDDLMTLCKDLITATIKPYNSGWYNNPSFDKVDDSELKEFD